MRNKVIVIGGGVAGLTAAHELVERGFEVDLYERRSFLGGKSASRNSAHGFPGEHGFRFFPGWYRHLPDTLERIPYKNRTVADNLVRASESLFASTTRDPIPALLRFPRSLRELATLAGFPEHLLRIGLTAADFLHFFGKLGQFAASTEAVRLRDFETRTWWEFMEADHRSEQFRAYLVDGVTRNTVAASPKQASAYTIATVALRTLMDTVRPDVPVDRVLNGPSSEVWIEPWVDHLKAQGVRFHLDAELEAVELDGADIKAVHFLHRGYECRILYAHARAWRAYERHRLEPSELTRRAWDSAVAALAELGEAFPADPDDSEHAAREAEAELAAALRKSQDDARPVTADHYVFALPVEQMAYYIQRSEMLQRRDPFLKNVIALSNHVEWMSGIQFYLTEDLEITPGHIDCLDSEWALTAISQAQFWSEVDLKERGTGQYRGKVKAVLSVDISAWNVEGRKHKKEAYSCTPREVAEEVWDQLQRSLNRKHKAEVLRTEHLLDYDPRRAGELPATSYYLDQEIVDRFDRKKQAFYKRYESVRFSAEAVAERVQNQEGNGHLPTLFAHGARLQMNAEPLLVNRTNTLKLRPTVRTKVENMFLAADYVLTNTNLSTMEAANEAGRRAVNEILAAAGSRQEPCRIWSLAPAADLLANVARWTNAAGASNMGGVQAAAVSLASTLGNTASRALGAFVSRKG
jgi:uncharacterized protein with NAD-binding domain and iron-sulfur cluster